MINEITEIQKQLDRIEKNQKAGKVLGELKNWLMVFLENDVAEIISLTPIEILDKLNELERKK